eukprot:15479726-Alexandrium_andersonii.AAC.1
MGNCLRAEALGETAPAAALQELRLRPDSHSLAPSTVGRVQGPRSGPFLRRPCDPRKGTFRGKEAAAWKRHSSGCSHRGCLACGWSSASASGIR